MRITVPGFSGVVRITAPQRLEDHQAQVAVDCDFRSGDLRPYYGDAASDFTTSVTPGSTASLFLYDQGQLLTDAGDKDFARSPVFYADSQGNDKRVFYAEAGNENAYPRVLESFPSGGVIPSGASEPKRLGVPRPAGFNEDLIDREEQSGDLIDSYIYTYSDGYILLPPTAIDDSHIKKGDKLLLEAPGYALGQSVQVKGLQAVEVDGTVLSYQATLEKDRRQWKDVSLGFIKGETTVRLKLSGHGFVDGDLVFFSHRLNGSTSLKFPPTNLGGDSLNAKVNTNVSLNKPFRVTNATYTDFELQFYDSGWTTVALNVAYEAGTYTDNVFHADDTEVRKKVALLASSTLAFPDDALPTVTIHLPDGNVYHAYAVTNYEFKGIPAKWYNAATADIVADRSYCVTFVNAYGDESEPSLPTDAMTVVPGSPVTFGTSSISTDAEGAYVGTPTVERYIIPTEIRLYRTDATGTFRLVTTDSGTSGSNKIVYADVAAADPIYVDTLLDSELGEPLSTQGWSVPSIGMHGLVNVPNGVVAGFRGRTIFGSVPYAPYAWPVVNQVATDYDVVGLVPTSAGLVVVTEGMPSILIGSDPATWSMQKLEYPQGCVARRSIVDMGEFAMYASPDGLVAITGANVEILTKPIMTREQWQAYNPSSIVAAQVEGRYIATYVKDGSRHGFIYDPQTQSFTDLGSDTVPFNPVAFCNDLLNDVLLAWNPDGSIVEWNQDTTTWKPYLWISKWFQLPIPELMGVAQIFTTTIDLTGRDLTFVLRGFDNNQSVKIYEISTDSSPDAILGNRPFRIPYVAPGRFTAFRIELSGSIPVGTVMVGRTVDELKLAP